MCLYLIIFFCDMKTSPTKEASEKEETQEEEKPAPEVNGHAEEVEEKEPEKSEQVKDKGEESETSTGGGTEVLVQLGFLLLPSAEIFITWPCVWAVLPDQLIHRDGLVWL